MIKFTTEQLYWLHDQLKGAFLKKKNVPMEIQKFYYHITTQLLKQEKKEENLSNIKYKDYFKPTEKQIENEKKLKNILETNRDKIEELYNKEHDKVHYLVDEEGHPTTPAFYSINELIRHLHHEKIDMSKCITLFITDITEYYARKK